MSRGQLLLLLVLLLGAALLYAWQATPQLRRVERPEPLATARNIPTLKIETPDQHLPQLLSPDNKPGHFQEPYKNLFGPVFPRPLIAKLQPQPVVQPPRIPPQPPPVPEELEPVKQLVTPPPLPPLEVLGYLVNEGKQTVFLSSRGVVYLVREGDLFAENLYIKHLDRRSVTIGRSGTDHQVVLQTGEAQSQRLPSLPAQSGRARQGELPEIDDPELDMPPPVEQPEKAEPNRETDSGSAVRRQSPDQPVMRSIDEL